MPPRRSFLALLATFPALMANSTDARHKKHRKKRKPSPLPPPPPPRQCDSYEPNSFACGPYCCDPRYQAICCDYPLDVSGKRCFDTESQCCPANLGGGGCKLNQTCCPAQKGGVVASCANTSLGQFCCSANSGGFCDVGQGCCPSETTNSHNLGCCLSPEGLPGAASCCNTSSDCTPGLSVCNVFTGCCENV
jgi:hypothetical protein